MFTEASTVENLVRDLLCGGVLHHTAAGPGLARHQGKPAGLGWHFLPATAIPRPYHEVLVEPWVRDALARLNPEIAADPGGRRRARPRVARALCGHRAIREQVPAPTWRSTGGWPGPG